MIEEIKGFFGKYKIKVNSNNHDCSQYLLEMLHSLIKDIDYIEEYEVTALDSSKIKSFIIKQKRDNKPHLLVVEGKFILPLYPDVQIEILEHIDNNGALVLNSGEELINLNKLLFDLELHSLYPNNRHSIVDIPNNLIFGINQIFSMDMPSIFIDVEDIENDYWFLSSIQQFDDLEKTTAFSNYLNVDASEDYKISSEASFTTIDVNGITSENTGKLSVGYPIVTSKGKQIIDTDNPYITVEFEDQNGETIYAFNSIKNITSNESNVEGYLALFKQFYSSDTRNILISEDLIKIYLQMLSRQVNEKPDKLDLTSELSEIINSNISVVD